MIEPDKFVRWQIDHLQAEIAVAGARPPANANPLAERIYRSAWFRFVTQHLQNFYWTVTRLAGLGYLHDPKLRKPEEAKRDESVPPPVKLLVPAQFAPVQRPRILFDVTLSAHYGTTGIARVIREYAKSAVETGCGVPVIVSKSLDLAPAYPQQMPGQKLTIETGDILFLFDWMGNEPGTFIRLMEAAVQKGARVVLGLHDILPFMYPGLFSADTGPGLRTLVDRGVSLADGIVTVSRNAAENIRAYIIEAGLPCRPGLGIGWNHLGADFQSGEPAGEIDPKLADVFQSTPVFLMVGTVEPRKGHRAALAAFDKLWRDGADVRCLIIGGMYWNARSIGEEIHAHPEFGRRLFWFDETSDADVAFAYRHATSLIFASLSEGFGLPLVEAAKFGLPIIASDIPVFREIAGDTASYFEALDADSLAARLCESLAGKRIPPAFPVRTWHESALDLFALLRSRNYQLALPAHVSSPASLAS